MNILFTVSLLFGLILFQLRVSVVEGLKCYTCTSNCEDIDGLSKIDCDGGFCTKTSDTNNTIISRGCSKTAKTEGCSNTNNLRICACKEEDLCNGSLVTTAATTFIWFMVIAAILPKIF